MAPPTPRTPENLAPAPTPNLARAPPGWPRSFVPPRPGTPLPSPALLVTRLAHPRHPCLTSPPPRAPSNPSPTRESAAILSFRPHPGIPALPCAPARDASLDRQTPAVAPPACCCHPRRTPRTPPGSSR
ncbi:hypothetical protein BS78_08G038600 [Paspalum vaginatum]|nr:hypothetical protein BS78_08G038600 [Paspalum vaginatum]